VKGFDEIDFVFDGGNGGDLQFVDLGIGWSVGRDNWWLRQVFFRILVVDKHLLDSWQGGGNDEDRKGKIN